MNKYLSKEDIQKADKHMKRCQILVIRKMQIKTTVKCHFISSGIMKMTDDKQGCGKTGTPYLASGNVITQSDGFEKSGHSSKC